MRTPEPQMNCYCHFCGEPLRFHISRVGEAVNCFHCSMESVLFIPGLPAPYPETEYQLGTREIGWGLGLAAIRHLGGVVVNHSNKNLSWVRIEFILYNKQGGPIGTTSDCLIGVSAGKAWKFKAPVVQAEAMGASEPILSCEYGRVSQPTRPNVPRPVSASAGLKALS
jgi:hypothetical protein